MSTRAVPVRMLKQKLTYIFSINIDITPQHSLIAFLEFLKEYTSIIDTIDQINSKLNTKLSNNVSQLMDESSNNKTLNLSMSTLKATPKSIDMRSSNYQRVAKNGGNLMEKLNVADCGSETSVVTTDMELCALLFWLLSTLVVTIFNFSFIRLSNIKITLFRYVTRFYSYFVDGHVNDINNQSTSKTFNEIVRISHTDLVKAQLKHLNYWFLLPLSVTTIAYGWILLLWFITKIFLIKVPTKLFSYKTR